MSDIGLETLKRRLECLGNAFKEREITSAIKASRGSHGLLAPHVSGLVSLRWDADAPVLVVVDENGRRRLRPGATSADDYMTTSDLLQVLRDDVELGGAFEGSGSSGSGSNDTAAEPRDGRASEGVRILG